MATTMKNDGTVEINWFRVNVPTIGLIVVGLFWFWFQMSEMQKGIALIEQSRRERIEEANKKFAEVTATVSSVKSEITPISNLVYRVDILERQFVKLTDAQLLATESLRRDVTTLTTKVEVMSGKIDDFIGSKRADLGDVPREYKFVPQHP